MSNFIKIKSNFMIDFGIFENPNLKRSWEEVERRKKKKIQKKEVVG